ncbi:MAG TPA: aminotransferase class V-fold PLP-dependent enzyme [Candidatus Eremiobacteraceae bacterium]|nr:aminotransferase class V-fold PLP-dependent enzyme [Candidatus Eremiobacteraceae bacterium]
MTIANNVTVGTSPLDQALFPVCERWAYCNHAAVGPLPRPAHAAMVAAMDAQMADGCNGILDIESRKEDVRAAVAAAINAESDEIAFMRATSDGALLGANGIDWRAGDEIVLTDNEFGANAYPWLSLRDKGVRVKLLRAPKERLTVETLERVSSPRTRLVAVSFVSFGDGYRHDLAALGAWCRERGIIFAIDAIQGFGQLPLDVRACGADLCYFGVAKWLLSPQGLSVVFVSRDLCDRLRPTSASWRSVRDPMNFLDYAQEFATGAARFEGGTINYPGLIAFGESLRLLDKAGFEKIETHVLALTDRLIAGCGRAGLDVLSSVAQGTRSGIVLVGRGGRSVAELQRRVDDARVQVTVRESGVRVAPHGYNTAADIDRVLDAIV